MSISRVNIQTPTFSLNAANIRGPQLSRLLDQLRRLGGSSVSGGDAARPAGSTGPGAMQSPADRFRRVQEQSGGADAAGNAQSSGFAPGGNDSLSSLDPGGMMQMIMQLLQRLLESIFSMLNGSGGGQSSGNGQCGGAPPAGSGGGPRPGCGGGTPAPNAPPTTPSSNPGGSGPGGPIYSSTMPTPTKPPKIGGSHGGSAPVPPRASTVPRGRRPRAQPFRKPSLAKRLLRNLGTGALTVGAAGVPGAGGAACAAASAVTRSCGSSRAGGTSLEDRIFEFMSSKLRDAEGELQGAMQQSDSAGGAGGDSRSAAAQKVQQLIQKRSEMVELLTNTMKTMHDSSMAVNRNIRS